jgi:hypothetical protein
MVLKVHGSLEPNGVYVIMLMGIDVGVYHLFASKIWLSLRPAILSIYCDVKNKCRMYLASQCSRGVTKLFHSSLFIISMA